MKRVLLASHSPRLTTGYGRVTAVLADALATGGLAVTVLGLSERPGESPSPRYSLLETPDLDAGLAEALRRARPDVLLTIGDPWMFPSVPGLRASGGFRWLAYFPVDGEPLPAAWANWVTAADRAAVFCEYTRRVVERATGRQSMVIPHGVDTRAFAPAADKGAAKQRVVGDDRRFVVGTVAVNHQRKNLPALVRAFAAFAHDKPDAVLYLHTPVDGCWDLDALVRHHGVFDRTRVTMHLHPQHGVGDDVLATIYHAMDVFVLPSMGEGFGLPILESQSCGVPALATDCSACTELLPDPVQRLAVQSTLVMARNFEQAVVDETDLAAKLELLYRDRGLLGRLGASSRALAERYDWETVVPPLVELVRDAAGS